MAPQRVLRPTPPSGRPFAFACLVLGIVTAGSVTVARMLTGGHLVYAVDDAYIHMAMGRTLADSGVWGISPAHVAFASSSPGWTLLLAVLAGAGLLNDYTPFVLNVIAAVAILWIVDRAARRLLSTERSRLWLLVGVVFVTPMPALALSGMETMWQVAAVLAFVAVAARVASARGRPFARNETTLLLGLAPAIVALRYESLFLVAGAALVLAWRRRLKLALALGLAAFVPVIVYAAFATAHGGWWLPAPIMLKGQLPSAGALSTVASFVSDKGFPALFTHWPLPPLVVTLLILLFVLSFWNPLLEGEAETWLLIATIGVLIHVHLVNFEWMFRYRAYIVVTCAVATAFGLKRLREESGVGVASLRTPLQRRLIGLALVATLAGPLVVLSVGALGRGPRGCLSIYLQQYQVARFLAANGSSAVAVNDIGAVSYYTRRTIVDLYGLADQPIAEARREARFDTRTIDAAVRQASADVAVIYEPWFEGRLAPPDDWVRVARWTAAEHVSTSLATVSFFATRPDAAEPLRAALLSWQDNLPPGVSVTFDEGLGR